MTAELISVGTEILMGNIVNTNAAWLAKECAALGLSCFYQSVVGDNTERLREQIRAAAERSDVVILTRRAGAYHRRSDKGDGGASHGEKAGYGSPQSGTGGSVF